jgi:hypothetical protein
MLGCPVAVLLAERHSLCTCARIVLLSDRSGDVVCFVCVCVQILCAYQTLPYLYDKSSWYPFVHCGCYSNPYRTCDKLQDTFCTTYISGVGRDSSVGVATRYGPDSPGSESQWGARFSASNHTGPGAHPASYTMGAKSFPGVKRPGRGVDHPPHLGPKLKKE